MSDFSDTRSDITQIDATVGDETSAGVGQQYGKLDPRRITGGAPLYPLLVLFGINAVDELDRTAFSILSPDIRDHFGLDNQGILSVLAVATVLYLFVQIPLGHWADRTNRVRITTAGAAIWALFSFGTGLAPSVLFLLLMRLGSGLGRSTIGPTHNSLISDYYEPSVRVKVFGAHRAANSVGQFVGPLAAGGIAYLFGWRTPFFIFVVPTIIFVLLALRLREPVRGRYERLAAGGDEDSAGTEDGPISFSVAWRTLWQVGTLRRIWYSIPFLGLALFGVPTLLALIYEDIFGLNEFQRGLVAALAEPAQLVGLLVGLPLANRLINRNPGLLLKFVAIVGVVNGFLLVVLAYAPNVWVAIAMNFTVSANVAVLGPGIYAALSLAIPPRVRSLGFSIGDVFAIPGIIIGLPLIGWLGDNYGLDTAMLVMVPVSAAAGIILASAGSFIEKDIQKVRAASLAQSEARRARLEGDPKLLIIRDLDVAYGQTQVLFGVNMTVDEGEIVALLGTNGAGKSTLLNAVSGLVDPTAGAIVYDGEDITMADPQTAVAKGLVMVPGGKGVFPTLTVSENIDLGGWLFRKDPEYLKQATEQVLEYFPVLRERWNQKAGNLSGGEQQMLTLSQAFIAQPKLLMIDELSLGLAPVIVEQLLEIVKAIHANGTTVILVEQSVNVAMSLAKRAVFMEKGEVRFDGPTEDLLNKPDILRAVFLQGTHAAQGGTVNGAEAGADGNGRSVLALKETKPFVAHCEHCGREHGVALETKGLSVSFGGVRAVHDVDLDVREGQILGLIGPNGAGKTTIFDLISGFVTPTGGNVLLHGEAVTELAPEGRAELGLGRSFQDARLFPSMTVREAIAVALERHIPTKDPIAAAVLSPATRISEKKVADEVDRLIELMHLGAFADKFVGELSTGSRRVVDLACSMAHDPKVLLLDEPSSGIAQRETEALGPLLLELREKTGSALVVIEHDMPLITGISDELIALDLGEVIARGAPEDVVNHPRVVESYLGSNEAVIQRSGSRDRSRRPRRARRSRTTDGRDS